jgi:hypothetical protein
MGEETPRVVVVLIGEEDAYAVDTLGTRIVVVSPDDTEKQWAGGCHYGDVRQGPSTVVVSKRINGLQEEGVAGYRAHGIVGDSGRQSAAYPSGVGEKRVETAIATLGNC